MCFFVCFLFSLSIIILRLIYVLFVNNLFYCWVVFCCIDISRCVYPLTCWGTFELFPVFGFSNRAVTIVYRCVLSFVLSQYWGWEWPDHMVGVYFNFLRNCKLFCILFYTTLSSIWQSRCSTLSPTSAMVSFENLNNASGCEVASH